MYCAVRRTTGVHKRKQSIPPGCIELTSVIGGSKLRTQRRQQAMLRIAVVVAFPLLCSLIHRQLKRLSHTRLGGNYYTSIPTEVSTDDTRRYPGALSAIAVVGKGPNRSEVRPASGHLG